MSFRHSFTRLKCRKWRNKFKMHLFNWAVFFVIGLVLMDSVQSCDWMCTDDYQPLCGTDGNTWPNECELDFYANDYYQRLEKNINDVTHSKSTRSLKSDRKFSSKVHFFRRPISRSHDRKDHFSSNRYFFSLFSFWGIDTQNPIGEWLIQFYSTEFAKNTQRSLCGWSSIWFRYIVDV